jgi:hypothetical protein
MTARPSRASRVFRFLPLILASVASSQALAQVLPYDQNCNPKAETEDEKFLGQVCESHAYCRFYVIAPLNAGCKGVNFLRNLGKKISGNGDISGNDVIDAATDDVPKTSTAQRLIEKARQAASAAKGAVGSMLRTPTGQPAYAETVDVGGGNKAGTMVSADGTLARGTFDSRYRLQGSGQLVTADGTMRAGSFADNQLNGEGVVAERDGNRTVLVEGTFEGDIPVGEVIRNYADGSRQRELWENGRLVAKGSRVGKGLVPPPVRPREVERRGLVLIEGPLGSQRFELWCDGQMLADGGWYPKGKTPRKPERQSCDQPQVPTTVYEDEGQPDRSSRGTESIGYDDSRVPSLEQLTAACPAEWMKISSNESESRDIGPIVLRIASSPSSLLLDQAQSDRIYADGLCQAAMRRGGVCLSSIPMDYVFAARCFVRATLNARRR